MGVMGATVAAPMKTRVAIVDDHPLIRAGVMNMLTSAPDLEVVCEGSDGLEAVAFARRQMVDVIIMEILMPRMSGLDALASIAALESCPKVLILTTLPEARFAPSVIRQGASGYLRKDCKPQELLNAVRTLSEGGRYIPSDLAPLERPRVDGAPPSEGITAHELLSDREFQVFIRLAQGHSMGHIAAALSLSVKSISTYRARVTEKLGMKSNSELTYYAVKHSLLI